MMSVPKIRILVHLMNSEGNLISYGGFEASWVNPHYEQGPHFNTQDFKELLNDGYLKKINRVQNGVGHWYAPTQKARDEISEIKAIISN